MYAHDLVDRHFAGPSAVSTAAAERQETQAAMASSVPDVPGEIIEEHQAQMLRELVARLCQLQHTRFPGAQPVSFARTSLDMLEQEDYWVCEKSDGQRVLMLIVFNKALRTQEVYLIDRKNDYRKQRPALFFPFHEMPPSNAAIRALDMTLLTKDFGVRKDTLLDGELVWDIDRYGKRTLRLLLFDCIVLDGTSMAHRPLSKRYGRLNQLFLPPFRRYMKEHPHAAQDAPFDIKVKPMELAYGIRSVLQKMMHLEHGNDGLIFTCIGSGYVSGTDPKIIKWKPPYENTIDFTLRLRFPPDLNADPGGRVPDFSAKPFFQLDEFMGRSKYQYFDWLYVDDEEWEEMKRSGEQFDDRVVECSWDPHGGPMVVKAGGESEGSEVRAPAWRLHRIRDDKHDGNHTSIVQKILHSIMDGVEESELLQHEDAIRTAWKTAKREDVRKQRENAATQNAVLGRRRGPPAPMRGQPPSWLVRR